MSVLQRSHQHGKNDIPRKRKSALLCLFRPAPLLANLPFSALQTGHLVYCKETMCFSSIHQKSRLNINISNHAQMCRFHITNSKTYLNYTNCLLTPNIIVVSYCEIRV